MNEIKAGDYVITPSSNTDDLLYGIVKDQPYDYIGQPKDNCPYRHRRAVKWMKAPISRGSFSVDFQNSSRSSLTVFSISQNGEFLSNVHPSKFSHEHSQAGLYEDKILRHILEKLDSSEFEILIKSLLVAWGADDVEVTGRVGDGGVDIRGTLHSSLFARIKLVVQVKRYKLKSKISAKTIREFRGAVEQGNHGLVITTADFH